MSKTVQFSKEEMQMIDKYLKRYSTFLSIRDMQTQTALGFCLTSEQSGWLRQRKQTNYKNDGQDMKKKEPYAANGNVQC